VERPGATEKDEIETTIIGHPKPDSFRKPELHLVVMAQEGLTRVPLALGTVLIIGRAKTAGLRIDDPLASRDHAKLQVGDKLLLEDLGSANGTFVGGVRLEAGTAREVALGEPVTIGSTTLMVQQTWARARPKRLWQHGYFEARLEEECARARRTGTTLAVVRIHVQDADKPALADSIAGELRVSDVLASYGPSDFEVLMNDVLPDAVRATNDRIYARLSKDGFAAPRIGTAFFPDDAGTPDALVARANLLATGTGAIAGKVVVHDEAMRRLYEFAERMAHGNITVLILGETGVGKEVLAEAIHRASPRRGKPFVRLNCAAFADTLVESELFGYERGAFTGAAKSKAGLLETAEGGTVFLDEVGELSVPMQVKLLRVLETHEVVRVGGLKPKTIDVRFIAATNRDLESEVMQGTFRQDLYFRLNGVTVVIPPLRERLSELEYLAEAFVSQISKQLGRTPPAISKEAREALRGYCWTGNIRELKNMMERAVLLCTGSQIVRENLPLEKMGRVLASRPRMQTVPPAARPEGAGGSAADRTTPAGIPSDERTAIVEALSNCAGNQSRAAKLLGISRRTLISRLDALGVARPRK
jgi:DNA-binding NtrC family response regulator